MKYLVFLMSMAIAFMASAQAPVFSPVLSPQFLSNASLAGIQRSTKLYMGHYQSWLATRTLQSSSALSLESALPRDHAGAGETAVGGFVLHDAFGSGGAGPFLTRLAAGGVFAYHRRLSKKSFIHGGLGFQGIQYSMEWNNLLFSNQLHPIFGRMHQSSPGAYPVNSESFGSLALDGGAAFSTRDVFKGLGIAKTDYLELGMALKNWNTNRLSFYDFEAFQPRTLISHLRVDWSPDKDMTYNNRFITVLKMDYNDIEGGYGSLNMHIIDGALMGGLGFGNTLVQGLWEQDILRINASFATVFNMSSKKNPTRMMIAYAYHASLNRISNNRMGSNHELTIMVHLKSLTYEGMDTGKVRGESFF